MDRPLYHVRIQGCDDSTHFNLHLSAEELAVVERLELLSCKEAAYNCQPVLYVVPYQDELYSDYYTHDN